MKLARLNRIFAVTLIGLFVALQVFGTAHATQHSDSPHEHDGITCDIGVTAQDHSVVLPSVAAFIERPITSVAVFISDYQSAAYLTPPGRAPPPRSPPVSL